MSPLYYVAIDPETRIVRTWYALTAPPTAPGFFQITQDEYNRLSTMPGAKLTSDGTLEEYTPPPPPAPSLASQAEAALQQVRVALYNNYGLFGEAAPDDCVAYVRALTAIARGKDTTSTTLPTTPADLNPS